MMSSTPTWSMTTSGTPRPPGPRGHRRHPGRCLTIMGISHLISAPMLGIDISPGVHPHVKLGPLTIDIDIVWATLVAAAIVITMGLILAKKATSGVPGKFQLLWELAV